MSHDAPPGGNTLPASTIPVTAYARVSLSLSSFTSLIGSLVLDSNSSMRDCPLALSSISTTDGLVVGLPSAPQYLGPKPTLPPGQWASYPPHGNFAESKKRGAIEGPIRISLCSSLFLFNVLLFPHISSNSLKLQSELFSIPTAPTNQLIFRQLTTALSTNSGLSTN